ncbi:hypothetical protein [Acinetobacter sp. YH12140]|uniref:hypothetical protein n=1 Tax=Acinetobacter sp. YH12140 TaxID=2601124 RepID=UPI0015D1A3C0|nr:hypothetical protein [Acinetobacter sp. YH12140]
MNNRREFYIDLFIKIFLFAFYALWLYVYIYLIQNDLYRKSIAIFLGLVSIFYFIDQLRQFLYVRNVCQKNQYQYIKTYGHILQVIEYDKSSKKLSIAVQFEDIHHHIHQKNIVVLYPNDRIVVNEALIPKNLEGQAIELCLTPNLAIVLQIRAYHPHADKLPILTRHFHKHPLWQRHEHLLLHPSYFYPESMQSIHFIREDYAEDFQILFQGLEQNFQVSSTSPSFEQIENYIFASYSDFFMKNAGLQPAYNEYRKLKFTNEPIHVELWKNENYPISEHDIRKHIQKTRIHAAMLVSPCLLISLSVFFSASKISGLLMIGVCMVLLMAYYSYLLRKNYPHKWHSPNL